MLVFFSTGASGFGASPSGLLGTIGASPSLTAPVNSGTSLTAASAAFTPPVNSGALGTVGTSSGCLASSEGASLGFTPPEKSLDSSPLGTSFKFSI